MYRHGREDRNQHFIVLPVPAINYIDTSSSYAVYGELTRLLLGERLELTAGLRHFHDDVDQDGRVTPESPLLRTSSTAEANTPRVLVNWHVTDSLMTYASYAEGFRSGFPQDPPVLLAFPDFPSVKPDRLKNYEIGAKGSLLDGRLGFSAAAYHLDWQEIQLLLSVLLNGVPYPGVVNGASASGNGVDLELTIAVGGLRLSPYVSWNDLAVSEDVVSGSQLLYRGGERPSGSPETTAGLSADFTRPIGATTLRLSASANYTSTQSYRSITSGALLVKRSDDVFMCRARAALDFAERWTATLYGDNLTDWHGVTADMFPGDVPDWKARVRPRTVGLQLEYRFR
jgi:outer membrane receptor protein involved in Fe transport